ncbi:hypothetical protein LKD70_09050 [Ruminococcus sp. CLA-AA-H200]|uniref:Uncharacterized protein n=1 Tax=Ruminococcus turbiniformis TaxID=2881258 RepID=A0ABS8FWZ7_9FIRM|nr:hypothetical protein [Ruminococcus turbiniformis]MCC2254561.1 hypothetical protein [Ruminococcus turbiniformis]
MVETIMQQYIAVFTPDPEEQEQFRERLMQYTPEELENLYRNFAAFGVDAVLECIYHYRD